VRRAQSAIEAEVFVLEATTPEAARPLGAALVVCIDNEPGVLAGMQTMLDGWGCQVIAASDSQQAISQLDSHRVAHGTHRTPDTHGTHETPGISARPVPTIIVADYHLDFETGVDAILAIQAHTKADVPGVIITADHSPEVQRRLRALEFTLLRKPLKAGALRAVLMQTMRRMAAE